MACDEVLEAGSSSNEPAFEPETPAKRSKLLSSTAHHKPVKSASTGKSRVVVRQVNRPANNPPDIESDHELAHRSVRVGEGTSPRGPPPLMAFTITQFCAVHQISESMYFKEKAAGRGPDEMHVGSRRLISFEAAARWRREREASSAA
jgi:hypothetical protein